MNQMKQRDTSAITPASTRSEYVTKRSPSSQSPSVAGRHRVRNGVARDRLSVDPNASDATPRLAHRPGHRSDSPAAGPWSAVERMHQKLKRVSPFLKAFENALT